MKSNLFIFSLLFVAVFSSCKKDPEIILPASTDNQNTYAPVVPTGWPSPVYDFTGNEVTYDIFTLGRHLFYEPLLSGDSTISCGSCHMQTFGFSNGPSHATSHGVNNLTGKRNSPGLFNLTWQVKTMWDGGVNNLENQPLGPIQNPIEMNLNYSTALSRIAGTAKYKALFKNAYGDTVVTSQRFLKSFAQFMGLMVSYNSKYDKVKNGNESFTASENSGYTVFKSKCASCHAEPLFTDHSFRNNGLPINSFQDSGRYRITLDPNDIYKFKMPSLRNLGFTAPYMHDGRFQTLTDVLNHYSSGISSTQNLDPSLNGGIPLSAQEKSDLLSFLTTLNDYSFKADTRFKEIH
ncbi:MAG: cytochrome-c peroxidase [Bacteroidia bacterium]|nr:cytochrome-c peroxidase [Bacteroidia bacterium]